MKKLILISAMLFSFNGWAECISGNCVNGEGTRVWPGEGSYTGQFRDGYRDGCGSYKYPSGSYYTGEWQRGKVSGKGFYTYPNGKYIGEFKDDSRHGKGIYTFNSGIINSGIWKNGTLIEARKLKPKDIYGSCQETTPSNRSQARTDAINSLMGGLVGAGGFLLLAFIILGVIGTLYFYSKKIAVKAKPKIESTAYSAGVKTKKIFSKLTKSEMEQFLEIDDKYFQIATDEIESNTQQQGLWMKVGALAEGNIEKQKALYIKHRAKQLSEENK